jgi:GNAT superfamily N-acetyltransferase
MGSVALPRDEDLPRADSPHLILAQSTPEEYLQTIRLNSVAWRGLVTLDQYIERERRLSTQNLTKDGALTSWILVDGRQQPNARLILSSCETYRKPAYLAYQGKVEDIICHGIGSVFARAEFRGRGYAGRMMEEVAKKLDTWQSENQPRKQGVFSVLFSDIGKKFYTRYGWKPFESSHMSLPPLSEKHFQTSLELAKLPVAKTLTAEDVYESMCGEIVERKNRNFLQVVSQKSPGAKVSIAPDYDHLLWHWAREQFYQDAGILEKVQPQGQLRGAGVDHHHVYCAWTRKIGDSPTSNTLYILRLIYDEPSSPPEELATIEAVAAVLRRAQLEAYNLKMSNVEFWNPSPLTQKAAKLLDPNVQVVHRDGTSISSLKWNGASQGLGDDVEWLWNEKYSWC